MSLVKVFIVLSILALSRALILNCEYNKENLRVVYTQDNVYVCKGKIISNLHVDTDLNNVTDVTQAHLPGKTNKDVYILNLSDQSFHSLPKGIDKFFTNLRAIIARSNSLKVISKDDLKVFKSLEYLSLYNNDLTTLDSDLFTLSPKLKFINFGHNKIRNIGRNIFKPLKNLESLYFHDGKMCVNKSAEKAEDIPNLILELEIHCPPTYEMLMKDIWSDEEFLKKLDERIDERVKFFYGLLNN